MAKLAALLASVAVTISGCGPQNGTIEISGTTAERVAVVSRLFSSDTTPPSDLQDAHLIELQFGDGQLGPSDIQTFVWAKVAPSDVVKWQSVLKSPPSSAPAYDTPPSKPKWWLSKNTYDQLDKFDSRSIFPRQGWIAIDDDGNIYALTFTQ
jgi:hypothetical protein